MRRDYARYGGAFALLVVLLAVLVVWNVNAGSVHLSLGEVVRILTGPADGSTEYGIIWGIRLPRICAAVILGGALSVSGFLLQTFFANPIAGPFVLGISSGAKLVVSLVMIFLLSRGLVSSSMLLIAAAFVGAMLSMGFILLISRRVRKMSMLVVCGVMIGYICSAVTDFVVTFAEDSNIVNLHNWSMGSFSGIYWDSVAVMAAVVGVTLLLTFLLSKPIGAYQMGEVYAQNMGVNIRAFRAALILLSSVLSACVTAFAGPISFVGIAVPHLVKSLFRTAKPILMIPACFLGGAVFCLFCDLIARTAFAPTDMSISSVTAIFGAPVVIYTMISQRAKTMA
ncbi:iron ABC transporter permease [uncultured Dysosmobacter sp.]|uniref:FecCD family ABC transporter permease n=1 Tax=uncultured Dysosmobacter sp. TaxID=2591384 RepID=UPI0026390D80|nr:iron ABC transporter permease [uncultured Dysosmobacter sp.]